jgi:MtrB/PioB family decaheme-associated outer membrane protein
MRTRLTGMVAALLLASAAAAAQQNEAGPLTERQIDIGVRGTAYDAGSDEARYQRYRDLRDGVTVDFFRYLKEGDGWQFSASANHLGYRDQRAAASFTRFGKVKAAFAWDQLPLFYSGTTRTLFTEVSTGVFTMADGLQVPAALPGAINAASAFDLRQKRHTANASVIYSASRNTDITLSVTNTLRQGAQPYAGTFGIGGAVAAELPMPLDQRTTDLRSALEWANGRVFTRVAYDASFFRNDVQSLTWDNPARSTDIASGSSRGRLALAPDSDMNTLSASGSVRLPGRSRAAAFVSYGVMAQDTALLPFSINSAHPVVALPRATAQADAHVTAMNYSFTSSPVPMLWFNARYRQYEFDNRTPEFHITQWVNWDSAVATGEHTSEPFGYTRHTFDGDAVFSPTRYVGVKVGYTREQTDRLHRVVEETTENVVRASVDSTGLGWLTVRGIYEHAERRGSPVHWQELLAIGEQPTLRHFDISDRDRDRLTGMVTVTPISQLSFNASAAMGNEEYPGTHFGLRDNDNVVYTFGVDVVPRETLNFGVSVGYEEYNALQASRTANPLPARTEAWLADPTQQFNNPLRDWTNDTTDIVKTLSASADLLRLVPKTEFRFGYDLSRGRTTYLYQLTAGPLAPADIARPVQLPPVENELHRATADVKYFLNRHLAIGGAYIFDRYLVEDFALGDLGALALPVTNPALVLMGYTYRPYTAHTTWARVTYYW